MDQIKEVKKFLSLNSKNLIQVLPGTNISLGKKITLSEIENIYGSVEEFIKKFFASISSNQITIVCYSPNGSSFIKRNSITINKPVDSSTKTVDASTTTNQQPTSVMNDKAELEKYKLEIANQYLNKEVADLKEQLKKTSESRDSLYNENLALIRSQATEKDKLDLEYKRKELELQQTSKQGLSGIIEDVKQLPPEAFTFLAGFFPKHAMNKAIDEKTEEEQEELGTTHEDPAAQEYIDAMVNFLMSKPAEVVSMIVLINQKLVGEPNLLKETFLKYYPQQQTTA